MGMFDSVMAECPVCGRLNEFQTKGGRCNGDVYSLDIAPIDVLSDVNRHPVQCQQCSTTYKVVVKCFSKTVVVNPNNEKDDDG